MVELRVLDAPPEGLFALPAAALHRCLAGPTLLHIPGRQDPPLFISVLLHGNETSGWNALARFLLRNPRPPRRLVIFIGNVAAAASGQRVLPQQPDYNRIWKNYPGPEGTMARALLSHLAGIDLFAAVDIHNNTGRNPHYSVLTNLKTQHRALGGMFSDKAVYVEEPDTVLSRALHDQCPAITVEVGPVDDPQSDARTLAFLDHLMEIEAADLQEAPDLNMHRSLDERAPVVRQLP